MPFHVRSLLVKLLLAFVALACTLIVCDIFIRLFYPEYVAAETDKSFWHYDEVLGWKHRSNEAGRMIIVDELGQATSVGITINTMGFRDKERVDTGNKRKYRIDCLGDSFVFGYGVPIQNVFPQRMEELNGQLEVLNFGVSGYSTDQELLLLENHVLDHRPDVVLLFFTNNDIEANNAFTGHGYPKPKFEFSDRKLVLTNIPVPDMLNRFSIYTLDNYMRKNSALYCFVRFRLKFFGAANLSQWIKKSIEEKYQGMREIENRPPIANRDLTGFLAMAEMAFEWSGSMMNDFIGKNPTLYYLVRSFVMPTLETVSRPFREDSFETLKVKKYIPTRPT
jgi:hypothetical protein